jgi:hypothetical protein
MKTKKSPTFSESVNWEYVHAHQKGSTYKVKAESTFVDRIIEHARRNGFTGTITNVGAARVINANLY